MIKRDVLRTALYVTSLIALSSCEKGGSNFSLSSTSSKFEQSAVFVPRQLDVLFVVDNSGSMKTSQTNLAQNFPSFINYFKGYRSRSGHRKLGRNQKTRKGLVF